VDWSKMENPESWSESTPPRPDPWYVRYPDDMFDLTTEKESIPVRVLYTIEEGNNVRYGMDRERASYVARILNDCVRGRVFCSNDDAGWYVAMAQDDVEVQPLPEGDRGYSSIIKDRPYAHAKRLGLVEEDERGLYSKAVRAHADLLSDSGEVDLPVDHLAKELPYVSGPLD